MINLQYFFELLSVSLTIYYDYYLYNRIPEASNNTEIVLSNVNCDDVDNSFSLGHLHILRCSFQTQVPEYCSHKTDAAVACSKFNYIMRKINVSVQH